MDPQQAELGASLEVRFWAHPSSFFSCAKRVNVTQTNTELAIRASNKGGPNRGASRLGEVWPRQRLGRKTYWHKDKARPTGTRNYKILLLKFQQGWTWNSWWLCCLARILGRSWCKGTASRQASKLQGYGKLQQNRQASMQVSNSNVARPLEIRTKHFGAGFEAGLKGLKAWKLEQNNITKKGGFFASQNVTKSRRAKTGLPRKISPRFTDGIDSDGSPQWPLLENKAPVAKSGSGSFRCGISGYTVASMLLIFPCVRLDCVSSASKTCLDYVWSANVFMLSVWAILPAQVFPFLLWLKLLVCCTIESDHPADRWMKIMSTLFASPYKFGAPDCILGSWFGSYFGPCFGFHFWAPVWAPTITNKI